MIFFAIFIVNSFLNSGFGRVRGSLGLSHSLWSGLCLLLLWSVTLVGFGERHRSWVWEWLRVNKISSVRLFTHISTLGGIGLSNGLWCSLWRFLLWGVSLVGLGKWDRSRVWEWLWINEISSICFNLDLSSSISLSSVSGGRISLGFRFNLSSSVSLGLDGGVSGFDS